MCVCVCFFAMRCDDDHGLKDPLNVSLKELEEDETGESWKTDKEGKSGWVGGGRL